MYIYHMASHTGAGIIPYTIYQNKHYFILGKEVYKNIKHTDTGRFADFGGRKENNETPIATAVRECFEESMGVFGNQPELRAKIKDKRTSKIALSTYIAYFIYIPYSEDIVNIFDQTLVYAKKLYENSDATEIPEGHFEMSCIKWFEEGDFLKNKRTFRQRAQRLILKFLHYNNSNNVNLKYKTSSSEMFRHKPDTKIEKKKQSKSSNPPKQVKKKTKTKRKRKYKVKTKVKTFKKK